MPSRVQPSFRPPMQPSVLWRVRCGKAALGGGLQWRGLLSTDGVSWMLWVCESSALLLCRGGTSNVCVGPAPLLGKGGLMANPRLPDWGLGCRAQQGSWGSALG